MSQLAFLYEYPDLKDAFAQARAAINQVHRRPVNLRKVEITSSMAALEGAKLDAMMCAKTSTTAEPEHSTSAYSVLGPELIDVSVRTFLRAPLQLMAKVDVLAGGSGRPKDQAAAARLNTLARIIVAQEDDALLPAIVHGELLYAQAFGRHSATVARVLMRVAAIATGFDPRGLCVPEVYLHRHFSQYEALAAEFGARPEAIAAFATFHAQAFLAGAEQAERIAQTVKNHDAY